MSLKYFDTRRNRPIDFDQDGCDLQRWQDEYADRSFARHPKGFAVFVPPHDLQRFDEYESGDPYSVEVDRDTEFQRRRLTCTIDLVQKAATNLGRPPRILDIGCGQGHITASIRDKFALAEVRGLDYSLSAIEYAVDHYPGIDFVVGDAYHCPYPPSSFDIVVCNNLWEHVPDPLVLLAGIKQLLADHGYLVISTPSRYRLGNLLRVIAGKPVYFMSSHHVTEYSVGQVIEQLKFGGFDVVTHMSPPLKAVSLKSKIARSVISAVIATVGSHHQLEATIFYLARLAK